MIWHLCWMFLLYVGVSCWLDIHFLKLYFVCWDMEWGSQIKFRNYVVYVGVGLGLDIFLWKLGCVCLCLAGDQAFLLESNLVWWTWAAGWTFDFRVMLCMLGQGCPVEMQMFHLDYVISVQHIFSMCLAPLFRMIGSCLFIDFVFFSPVIKRRTFAPRPRAFCLIVRPCLYCL